MIVCEFIKYFFNSKGRHSFHSPFVYDFKDKCLTQGIDSLFLEKQEKQQKSLKKDHSSFEMDDFGAGSKKLKNVRVVSEVYKNAATKGEYLKILSQITAYYRPKNVLELGTSMGVGTFALSYGSERVVTVDACLKTQEKAKFHFPTTSKEVVFIHSVFDTFIANDNQVYDLIFIDGHHEGEALKKYLKMLDKNSHDETLFILDDIRWSKGMLKSWEEIISDTDYHLSMDLFKFGIVLKRQHQAKEHFIIRVNNVLKSL